MIKTYPFYFFAVSLFSCVLFLFVFQETAFSQSKGKLRPPVVKPSYIDAKQQAWINSPIIKIIDQAGRELPLAFAWQINADTLLKKNETFRELIEFTGQAVIRRSMAEDTISLKKNVDKDYDIQRNFLSFLVDMATFEISQQKGRDVLIFEHMVTHKKSYYKVFLDKGRKRILKLQSLSTGRSYWPAQFEGGSVSL